MEIKIEESDKYETARREFLKHQTSFIAPEDVDGYRGSQHFKLLEDLSWVALEYARSANLDNDSFELKILDSVGSIVSDLRYATTEDPFYRSDLSVTEKENLSIVWRHYKYPKKLIETEKMPLIRRDDLEEVVVDYLALPYRSDLMDRILVDALLGCEAFAYGHALYCRDADSHFDKSPFKLQNPVKLFARLLGRTLLIFAMIAGLAYGAQMYQWIEPSWFQAITKGLAGIFVFLTIVFLLLIRPATKVLDEAKTYSSDLHDEMIHCYVQLETPGKIHAEHILALTKAANEKGVVWPKGTFELLKDIAKRKKYF